MSAAAQAAAEIEAVERALSRGPSMVQRRSADGDHEFRDELRQRLVAIRKGLATVALSVAAERRRPEHGLREINGRRVMVEDRARRRRMA